LLGTGLELLTNHQLRGENLSAGQSLHHTVIVSHVDGDVNVYSSNERIQDN